jgi:NADH-quinone oxidoreductase subunit H
MFQMAEVANMVLISVLGSLLFLGGWNWPLGNGAGAGLQVPLIVVKTSMFILLFMWLRGTLPRLRIDQLMAFCWQVLLPFAFLQIIINGWVLVYDWPDWVLGALSGMAALAAVYLTYRLARQSTRVVSPRLHRVGSVL